jgi:hypothetical protein
MAQNCFAIFLSRHKNLRIQPERYVQYFSKKMRRIHAAQE